VLTGALELGLQSLSTARIPTELMILISAAIAARLEDRMVTAAQKRKLQTLMVGPPSGWEPSLG